MLCHRDNWLPGFSTGTDVTPIREEIERLAPETELLEMGYLDGTEILPLTGCRRPEPPLSKGAP